MDEVQLVLFETEGYSNMPTPAEVRELGMIADEHGLALTVHLPGSIELGDPDPDLRRRSIELFKRTVALTRALSPISWVLHLMSTPKFNIRADTDEDLLNRYRDLADDALTELVSEFDSSRDLAIENVYPHFYIEADFVERFDTSVCIDVGHLVLYGLDVPAHLARWLPRCRNAHIHGVDEAGRDHASLSHLSQDFIADVLDVFAKTPTLETVTMEIFGMADFEDSVEAMMSAAGKIKMR